MAQRHTKFKPDYPRLKYFAGLAGLYGLSILLAWFIFRPLAPTYAQVDSTKPAVQPAHRASKIPVISGTPTRLVIPAVSIDLPTDPGTYDRASDSWSLSGYHAQYALSSALANDQSGETFIYGHNNPYVFWNLKYMHSGYQAMIYTSNGHEFLYTYTGTDALAPNDLSVLNYQGPPILTVQTCSGTFNQWRQMYHFDFDKVLR